MCRTYWLHDLWLHDLLLNSADCRFLEFLRLWLPSEGECLTKLKHSRFCLDGEIEFLVEYYRLTQTYRNLRSILSMLLNSVASARLIFFFFFVECLWSFVRVQNYFSVIHLQS